MDAIAGRPAAAITGVSASAATIVATLKVAGDSAGMK